MSNSNRDTAKDYCETQLVTTEGGSLNPKKENYIWYRLWIQRIEDDNVKRVMLIGDSITEGASYYIEKQLGESWRTDRLTISLPIIDDFFMPQVEMAIRASEKPYNAFYINIGLHTGGADNKQYEAAYRSLIDLIKKYHPKAEIVLSELISIHKKDENGNICISDDESFGGLEYRVACNNTVKILAEENGFTLCKLMDYSDEIKELHTYDMVHFTDAGYELLAKKIVEKIM